MAPANGAAEMGSTAALRLNAVAWPFQRRPTLGAELVLVAAWIALLALFLDDALAGSGYSSPKGLWWCAVGAMPGMEASQGVASRPVPATILAGMPAWALMACAMMLPAALPAVRHVAVNSLCWRRERAVLEFLAVYLCLWVVAGAALLGLLALPGDISRAIFPALALTLAAAWQLTPLKLSALRACHLSSPLPPQGWRATFGVARFARRNAGACVGSCWAMMLAAAVLPAGGQLLWMCAFAALVCFEKRANRPRRATRLTAAVLGAGALLCAVLAVA